MAKDRHTSRSLPTTRMRKLLQKFGICVNLKRKDPNSKSSEINRAGWRVQQRTKAPRFHRQCKTRDYPSTRHPFDVTVDECIERKQRMEQAGRGLCQLSTG
jgi:hypothetical protein